MQKIALTVKYYVNDKPMTAEKCGRLIAPGLVVVKGDDRTWGLYHRGSGLSVLTSAGRLPTMRAVVQFAGAIAPLTDWTVDDKIICKIPDLYRQVRAAFDSMFPNFERKFW